MRLKPAVGSVVGQVDETRWGQVLILPHAYGVIEIEDLNGQARNIGVNILTKLTQRLASVNQSLSDLEKLADEVIESTVKTLILLVPVDQMLYLVLRGKGALYLKRDSELALLLGGPGAVSGEILKGDTLLLVSDGFTQALGEAELIGVFDHLPAAEAGDKLTLILHEKGGAPGAAALVFQISDLMSDNETVKEENKGPSPFFRLKQAASQIMASWIAAASQPGRRGKFIKTIAVASVVGLFAVSVIVGIRKQGKSAASQKTAEAMALAAHAYEEGVALTELSPVKARERLNQAKTILEPFVGTVSDRTKEGRELKAFYQQVSDYLTTSLDINQVEPRLFYDVGLVKKGASGTSLSLVDDSLGLVDSVNATVFSVTLSAKSGRVVAGGRDYEGATLVATSVENLYVLTPGGIRAVRLSDSKDSVPVKKDDSWGTITSLVSYGGNLYLLDTQKSRIWKYVAGETGFSERREYLNPDTLPDITRGTSMAIDATVWVGTSDGKILHFVQGKESTFVLEGIEPTLGNNLVVYTDDTANNLYILDTANKRVVIVDKDGMYLSQYVWETELKVSNLVVTEKEKKILLLADGKIFSIDLK